MILLNVYFALRRKSTGDLRWRDWLVLANTYFAIKFIWNDYVHILCTYYFVRVYYCYDAWPLQDRCACADRCQYSYMICWIYSFTCWQVIQSENFTNPNVGIIPCLVQIKWSSKSKFIIYLYYHILEDTASQHITSTQSGNERHKLITEAPSKCSKGAK